MGAAFEHARSTPTANLLAPMTMHGQRFASAAHQAVGKDRERINNASVQGPDARDLVDQACWPTTCRRPARSLPIRPSSVQRRPYVLEPARVVPARCRVLWLPPTRGRQSVDPRLIRLGYLIESQREDRVALWRQPSH